MRLNEFYDKNYVTRLESLIHKLRLTHELNAYEQEYLNHYQGVVFAKIRNLKNLIVDFSTARNEEVYYKYENVGFYRLVNKRLIPTKLNGELFITTHKILLSSGLEIFTINFDEIMNFKISPQGLLIFTAHNIYSFKSYDDYLLYVSLERILKLKK
jgi:hypothetical protein